MYNEVSPTVGDQTIQQCIETQGGRGHWDVDYTSPQSLIITLSYLLG